MASNHKDLVDQHDRKDNDHEVDDLEELTGDDLVDLVETIEANDQICLAIVADKPVVDSEPNNSSVVNVANVDSLDELLKPKVDFNEEKLVNDNKSFVMDPSSLGTTTTTSSNGCVHVAKVREDASLSYIVV